jgi:hypothetical protein
MQIRHWAFVAMVSGVVLAILSVVADTVTDSTWWHLGTATGSGLFVYGMTMELLRRSGVFRHNRG